MRSSTVVHFKKRKKRVAEWRLSCQLRIVAALCDRGRTDIAAA